MTATPTRDSSGLSETGRRRCVFVLSNRSRRAPASGGPDHRSFKTPTHRCCLRWVPSMQAGVSSWRLDEGVPSDNEVNMRAQAGLRAQARRAHKIALAMNKVVN
jgi:hypothetical protein